MNIICLFIILLFMVYKTQGFLQKMILILINLMVFIAFIYESKFLHCGIYDCSLTTNEHSIKSTETFACQESSRVNWRRAIILAFIILCVLIVINENENNKNIVVFIIVWSLLYFYFNFDQYHRSTLACKSNI